MKKYLVILMLMVSPAYCQVANDISSYTFIGAMGLINADGNITGIDLQTTNAIESNPLAAPLAKGDTHYINNAIAITACIFAHDGLKNFDHEHNMNVFGTKDIFTLLVIGTECYTLSNALPFEKQGGTSVLGQVVLSEAEFMVTSAIFNIKF